MVLFALAAYASAADGAACDGYLVQSAGSAECNGCYTRNNSEYITDAATTFYLDANHTLYAYAGICAS